MSVSDTIAFWSLCISGVNVIITGVFSFLVWKATKQSSETAQSSYDLTREILNKQLREEQATKELYMNNIMRKAVKVQMAVVSQMNGIKPEILAKAPRTHGLTEVELAKYFDDFQRETIIAIWNLFEQYLRPEWLDQEGKIKQQFDEDEQQRIMASTFVYGKLINDHVDRLK
ncbi:hypothetical protein ACAF76_008330 [Brevibacillus sp. TJ4]|uniref:hypothetical protein n=1 Tax=Brevibacillus sp. TJ4 TaxID=3234853 RepID=UPI0037CD649F